MLRGWIRAGSHPEALGSFLGMKKVGMELLTRQGKLHQQPIHAHVVVEFPDQLQQLLLADGRWPQDGLAADPCNAQTHEAKNSVFPKFFTDLKRPVLLPEHGRVCAAPRPSQASGFVVEINFMVARKRGVFLG